MADFDDLMRDADLALYDEFGDAAVLTQDGTNYPVVVVIDRNIEVVVEGMIQMFSAVASINAPPVRPRAGATLTIGAKVWRVNRYLDDDGFTVRVAVI